MRYLLPIAFVLVLAGCTPEQEKKAGDTLVKTGQTIETIREVVKNVPNPLGGPLDLALGGIATLATALGGYYLKKSSSERKKKKAYKKQLTKEGLDKANKKLYGKKFDAALSVK